MEARTIVRGWLQGLGRRIGTPLDLPESGVCGIAFGNGRVCAVEVPADNGPIVVHAPILAMGGLDREPIFRKALSLSLFGAATSGFAIGYDDARDRLVLWASRSVATLDESSFSTLVGAAIATAVRLEQEFSEVGDVSVATNGDEDVMLKFATRV